MSDALRGILARLSPDKRAVLADLLWAEAEPMAIVGMGCRFPGGADNPDQFWELLQHGREAQIDVPADRWPMDTFYDPDPDVAGKSYVRQGGFLPDLSLFDADFFGISPREALRLDPQQRLLLETTWEALEEAGLAADELAGSATGVFIGMTNNQHMLRQVMSDPEFYQDPFAGIGSDSSAAAGRLAYTFDFHGPTISLDTACSSSLVALHLACQSLRHKECDLAVVGGVYAVMMPQTLIVGCRMNMFSADGRCKTFDARADGYGLGEGCGIVLVRRLSDALADGDQIKAIIRGTAVNEDGRSNGLTAPNGLSQQRVIRQALRSAGIPPRLVSYVEAHGTGTPLGDPIEVESIQAVLYEDRPSDQPIWMGSVKTNLGHLYTAAGIAGLVKTVLALQHQAIPPHLHLAQPNPHITWDARLQTPTQLVPWLPIDGRRIAGVSSFGWSGTNAHVILEEALPPEAETKARPYLLLPLSARTPAALEATTAALHHHIQAHPHINMTDLAYTLQTGRQAFAHRRVLLCRDREEGLRLLAAPAAGCWDTPQPARVRSLAFLFAGAATLDRTRAIYMHEPNFRQTVDECCQILPPLVGDPVRQILDPSFQDHQTGTAPSDLAPLAAFISEYALARLLHNWGFTPDVLLGQGAGALVAACIAGIFSLEDGLNLAARLPQADSAANGSPAAMLKTLVLHPPHIPYLCPLTGGWLTDAQATDPDHWGQFWTQSSRFSEALGELLRQPDQVLLEMGHVALAQQHPACTDAQIILPMWPGEASPPYPVPLLETVATLWSLGFKPAWSALYGGETPHRIPLPTYPFARERFWVGPPARQFVDEVATVASPVTAVLPQSMTTDRPLPRRPLDDWFYLPGWQQGAPPAPLLPEETGNWLLFLDAAGLGLQMADWLRQRNQSVVTVRAGQQWQQIAADDYVMRPAHPEDYHTLLTACGQHSHPPTTIVHLWTVAEAADDDEPQALDSGFYSLLYLAQALHQHNLAARLSVITSHTHCVTGDERLSPVKATILGPCRAIPLEYEQLSCHLVDVRLPVNKHEQQVLLDNLMGELTADITEPVVALRREQCWRQTFTPVQLPPLGVAVPPLLRQQGTYLVTGGLGGLGLAVADYLVKTVQANVVLLGRSALPPRPEWPSILAGSPNGHGPGHKIRQIQQLEAAGGHVLVLAADVADEQQMATAVQQALAHFGAIHGVIHAAGVPGKGLMQFKTPETVACVLAPKIKGTWVLEQVLRGIELDFLLLFSSIASFTAGGPGQADYAAANAFLDAYVRQCQGQKRITAVINWGEWQWNAWEGELAGFTPEVQNFFRHNREQFGIQSAEGTESLARILSRHFPQVIVSTQDFPRLVQAARQLTITNLMGRRELESAGIRHTRPALATTYVPPHNELERMVTAVWEQALRLTGIGIDDNFYELGGNSLIGLNLVKQLQHTLGMPQIPDRILYEAPSIRALAQILSQDQQPDAALVDAQHARGLRRRQQYAGRMQKRLNHG